MRVLGISGSLRRDSHNRRLLRAAADLLPPEVELVIFEGLKELPPFDEDDELAPGPAVAGWREAIADADALLFATPEYNSSIPGQLKNAIDWASRPVASAALRNKPSAVVGASTGMFGAVWAQAELRKALASAGARVIDRELPLAAADEAFNADGTLVEHDQMLELDGILADLLAERRGPDAAKLAGAVR
jgi:chromate reductase, NAD(P)H dehydrogenase (quinone)